MKKKTCSINNNKNALLCQATSLLSINSWSTNAMQLFRCNQNSVINFFAITQSHTSRQLHNILIFAIFFSSNWLLPFMDGHLFENSNSVSGFETNIRHQTISEYPLKSASNSRSWRRKIYRASSSVCRWCWCCGLCKVSSSTLFSVEWTVFD